jgi:hypothetical protein
MKKLLLLSSLGLMTAAHGQTFSSAMLAATGANQNQVTNQQPSNTQNYQNSNQNIPRGSVLSIKMPQRSLMRKLKEDTTLTVYQKFLGPTAAGRSDQTYNVFQASGSGPEQKSGRAPIQSFHAANLRHQINSDWAVGASLAATKGYAAAVTNKNGDINAPKDQFFNARAYVSIPSLNTRLGSLFTTLSYEAPTSIISRQEDMRYGWVVAQTFSFKLPSFKWSAGLNGQIYRMYYQNNVKTTPVRFTGDGPLKGQICTLCSPNVQDMQTLILSIGPYVNYQLNDHWLTGSALIFDWDQHGSQAATTHFNNNLPHQGRAFLTYFPSGAMLKNLASVGVFTQTILKFRPDTTAFGAEFTLRF